MTVESSQVSFTASNPVLVGSVAFFVVHFHKFRMLIEGADNTSTSSPRSFTICTFIRYRAFLARQAGHALACRLFGLSSEVQSSTTLSYCIVNMGQS